jgi:hypothetical protein
MSDFYDPYLGHWHRYTPKKKSVEELYNKHTNPAPVIKKYTINLTAQAIQQMQQYMNNTMAWPSAYNSTESDNIFD